ncbi:MAG: YdcF family protein [Acidobacteriota bacterium]
MIQKHEESQADRNLKKTLIAISKFTIPPASLIAGFTAQNIYRYGKNVADVNADAAIVLGAAVWRRDPSPVFRERINHAVELYRQGKVKKLILTGGRGHKNEPTESAAARTYVINHGVPASAVLSEGRSHSTYANIINAKQVADAHGVKTVLIVSDPLHMKRAMTMARDIGLDAYPSPTPTTRFKGWKSQMEYLAKETVCYLGYLSWRLFE